MASPRKLSRLRQSRWLLLAGYLLLAVIATVQQWLLTGVDPSDPYTHYNNYVIYRQSFVHLVGQHELYTLYLDEHWDYFRYSPSFALAFGVFAWMPDLAGLMLWNLLNVSVLFVAWRMLPVADERITIAAGWFVAIEVLTALQNSQSNVLLAGLLVLAFGLLERRQIAAATLMIVIAAFTKLFGLVAFSLFLLYPQKRKFILCSALWSAVIGLAPLLAVPPDQLVRLYRSWWNLLSIDYGQSAGLSVMAWLQSWFRIAPRNSMVGVGGVVLFCLPLLNVRRYRDFTFRLLFLCNILIWVVIFNHRAESSSYIIAMAGVALWYFAQERTRLNTVLTWSAFVFTSLSPTDLFPRAVSVTFFVPYAIKAVPCILIWGKVTYELVTANYRQVEHPPSTG